MKTTIGELKELIREAVEAVPVQIGSLTANIAGDFRYTDYLTVWYDGSTDKVTVTVSSSAPIGGMDGPGGTHSPDENFRKSTKKAPTARDVMEILKGVIGNDHFNFKRYGKPSKNFRWVGAGQGLSASLCTQALAKARGQEVKQPKVDTTGFAATWDAAEGHDKAKALQHILDYDFEDAAALCDLPWTEAQEQIEMIGAGDARRVQNGWKRVIG